ncbi:MAG: hypothetical protein AMS23_05310 [Bacteroides sp. SM1_62]|nr:MAG: hypothetical protein AMS26_08270 [Bacteroides sp. SM23_62]KPL24819.1 MAG: hypothetical protein AMS23_05310 [Bacteroides sp. SM1_62]
MQSRPYKIWLLVLIIPALLVGGCKSNKGKRAPGLLDDSETAEIVDRIETIKQVYHLSPSPAEMLSVIDVADLSFDTGLLNPRGNMDNYLDTKSRTMGLGVYITDLAYAALFGRHEETLDYLEVVRNMAEQIRVTGAINDELIEKARKNVEYIDSLFNISNEAFINMLFFCERNDRPNTVVILSAGAFVESLYLAVNLAGDNGQTDYILQHLADQKYALDNLMTFAESMKEQDPNVAAVIEDMKPIKEIYDGITVVAGTTTVETEKTAEGQPKKLVIGGGSKPTLSKREFEKLKKNTIELRNKLISN